MSGRDHHRSFHDHYNDERASSSRSAKSSTESEDHLRSREVAEDPMLEYFRDKERKDKGLPTKPVYKGSFPPNRYNIRPGHRWDGVNRSNGFESRLLEKEASKRRQDERRYRYEE